MNTSESNAKPIRFLSSETFQRCVLASLRFHLITMKPARSSSPPNRYSLTALTPATSGTQFWSMKCEARRAQLCFVHNVAATSLTAALRVDFAGCRTVEIRHLPYVAGSSIVLGQISRTPWREVSNLGDYQ